jgi:hypothetical protein
MRLLAVLVATCLPSACTSTVMAEPLIFVSPYLALYQMRGDVGMQSEPVPGQPLQDNPPQTMETFGQGHHREDVGVRTDIGDGFGGARIEYFQLDQGTADSGVLTSDWGRLLAGDQVSMEVHMEEVRLGYLEPLAKLETTWRDHPLSLRIAAGGVLAYREIDLRARTLDGVRSQNAEIEGDVFYPAARIRISWRDAALDVDYAISPNLVIDGDYDGVLQDVEARLSYTLAMRDVTFFGSYRYSTFPAEGKANGFAYEADLILDGFQLGVTVTF